MTIAVVVGAVVVNVGLLLWVTGGRSAGPSGDRIASLLAVSWVVLGLNSMHNVVHRSTNDVVNTLDVQTGIELLMFGLVGAVCLLLYRNGTPLVGVGVSMVVLPVWVLASASWGLSPLYALARGAEFAVLALLATLTAGYASQNGTIEVMTRTVFRLQVMATSTLIFLGMLLGPLFVKASANNLDRFTWIGAHPNNAGYLLGASAVILLLSRARDLRFAPQVHVALLLVHAVALFANQSRTVIVGVGICAVAAFVRETRTRPNLASLGALGAAAVGVAGAGVIAGYALRGDGVEKLWTLNGRTEVWQTSYDQLHGLGDWFRGLGYGASRVVFVEDYNFASSAHNSVISALVDLGLVGSLLIITMSIETVQRVVRARKIGKPHGATLLGMVVYTLVLGLTSDLLATPGLGTTILFFAAGAAGATLALGASATDQDQPRVEPTANTYRRR